MQCANSNSAWECQVDRNLKHLTIVGAGFDLRPKLYQRAWPSYKHSGSAVMQKNG